MPAPVTSAFLPARSFTLSFPSFRATQSLPAVAHNAAVDPLQREKQDVYVPRPGDRSGTPEDGDGPGGQPYRHVQEGGLDLLASHQELARDTSARTHQLILRAPPSTHPHP